MSNILQILTEGSGIVLNDIIVIKDYGFKSGATAHRAIHVKDSSGSTFVKLWGDQHTTPFNPDEVFTVQAVGKGAIAVSEYNGKKSLNCNDCTVVRSGNQPPAQENYPNRESVASTQAPSNQVSQSPSGALTPEQLADAQVAHWARIYKRVSPVILGEGGTKSDAFQAANSMTGTASDWWFGEKYPGCKG